MEQLAVGSGADFIDHSGLQVQEDGTGDVLASTSLGEEGVEGIVSVSDGLVGGHLAIRLDAMLKAVKLPACISDLGTGLSNVDGDNCIISSESHAAKHHRKERRENKQQG